MCNNKNKRNKPYHDKHIPPKYLKIMHLNIEGVISEACGNKLADKDCLDLFQAHDIVAITETHADNDTVLELPGYIFKRIVRPKSAKARKYSGGLAIAIRQNIASCVEIIRSKSDNIMWAKIRQKGTRNLMLGIVYISPINSSYTCNILPHPYKTWEILEEEIATHKQHHNICLLGDFNARTACLPDYIANDDDKYVVVPHDYVPDNDIRVRTNSDDSTNAYGTTLLDLCKSSELRIVNGRKFGDSSGKKTCHQWNGSSTVDYMIADIPILSQIQTFVVGNLIPHVSDHCPISVLINIQAPIAESPSNWGTLAAPKNIKWDNTSKALFATKMLTQDTRKRLDALSKMKLDTANCVEEAVGELKCILNEAANIKRLQNNPRHSKKKSNNKPWFSTELFKVKHALKKAGDAFMRNNNGANRQELFRLKKKYKSLVKRKKRQFRQLLYDKLEAMDQTDPKEYWELFDALKKSQNSEVSSCPIQKRQWIDHYLKLLGPKQYSDSKLDLIRNEISSVSSEAFFSKLDFPISYKEITTVIKGLKDGKSVGFDQISNEMIKTASLHILSPLQNIFNAILGNQYYPKEWKLGIITNLFKSGDALNPDNYRGLTINSCMAKVFNSIMNNRLLAHLEENNTISDTQIGFKKKARTSDHIFVINTLTRKFNGMKKDIYMCFVDFQKAYDSVWREALLLKLLRVGIKGNFFGVLKNMYSDCESCIKSDGELSRFFACDTGVRQGDVMSPNLFNIYINDLPDLFADDPDSPMLGDRKISCLLYADDLVLMSVSVEGLQSKLDRLHKYCQEWELSINVRKTKLMMFSPKGSSLPVETVRVGEEHLEWVSKYKYLGVEIHSDGSMLAAMENLCVRGWKATFKLKTALKNIDVNPVTRMKLFDTLIKPIICYASEVWGPINNLATSGSISTFWKRTENLPIEKFQLKYCKHALGVHSKATNAAVMGELGRLPLTLNVVKSMLRFWQHANLVKDRFPLLTEAFKQDKQLSGSKSWSKCLNRILDLFGLSPQTDKPSDMFIQKVMGVMRTKYIDFWRNSLGSVGADNGKLHVYRRLKSNFQAEPYLQLIRKNKVRQAMTNFRISSHRLEIETGRHTTKGSGFIKREERFCTLCQQRNINIMGDEEHALLTCPTFESQRREVIVYIGSMYPNFLLLDNLNKMIYMLTIEGECALKVGKLIHEILSTQRPKIR